MARPSKLTDKQWAEIEKRHIAGEKIRPLAKEFGVSEAAIRQRVSTQAAEIKDVAKQIASAEIRLESLPVTSQFYARSLADDLKAISANLASAARFGAMTANRLAGLANQQAEFIDDASPVSDTEALKGVAMLTRMANEASDIPVRLLAASQKGGLPSDGDDNEGRLTANRAQELLSYVDHLSPAK